MADSILRLPAVRARVGLSRSTIYLQIQQGRFPRPVRISERASGWLASEVDAYISQRAADRAALRDNT